MSELRRKLVKVRFVVALEWSTDTSIIDRCYCYHSWACLTFNELPCFVNHNKKLSGVEKWHLHVVAQLPIVACNISNCLFFYRNLRNCTFVASTLFLLMSRCLLGFQRTLKVKVSNLNGKLFWVILNWSLLLDSVTLIVTVSASNRRQKTSCFQFQSRLCWFAFFLMQKKFCGNFLLIKKNFDLTCKCLWTSASRRKPFIHF